MSAADNLALIETFYRAFQRRDANAMAACYRDDAGFHDPVFELRGERVRAMWRMLCARGKDLRIEFDGIRADESGGSANWQAWYTFSTTGRPVHNVIHARFRIADGLIVDHVDAFDFGRWARQAFGAAGLLLGWLPAFRARVRREAARALDRFCLGD